MSSDYYVLTRHHGCILTDDALAASGEKGSSSKVFTESLASPILRIQHVQSQPRFHENLLYFNLRRVITNSWTLSFKCSILDFDSSALKPLGHRERLLHP